LQEVTRALSFATSMSKASHPTCLAWAPTKEGPDMIVGTFDGIVNLLSLKSLIKSTGLSSKPDVAGRVIPEPENDEARITGVAWLPETDGLFVVATASGLLYMYKRSSVTGESSSKFLGLGGSSKPVVPAAVWSPGGGCVNDLAASPDGRLLAVACRDGALRLLDAGSGATLHGCYSHYGALLCCAFSADGKYVAAGGEDDLVMVYGVEERCVVAHLEGHNSWVSRVAFDPHAQLATCAGIAAMYRLASVGQDGQLLLWEVQLSDEDGGGSSIGAAAGGAGGGGGGGGGMRKSTSTQSLKTGGWQGSTEGTASGGVKRTGGGSSGLSGVLMPSLPRADMLVYEPIMERRLHSTPLSDLLLTSRMLYTADHGGVIKMWLRPSASDSSMQPQCVSRP